MARTVEITIPTDRTDSLVEELKANRGIISMKVFYGAGVRPAGDVIAVETTNRVYHPLLSTASRTEAFQAEQGGVGNAGAFRSAPEDALPIWLDGMAVALLWTLWCLLTLAQSR